MMKTIYLAIVVLLISGVGYGSDPTTIIRKPGAVGERIETVGKGAKENTVHVRPSRVVNEAVVQDRIVVKGTDVFASKAVKERKETKKETPQPVSIKTNKAVTKEKVGK
jgi:hypothetical protein